MPNGNFADAVAFHVGEHRDVAMEFAENAHVFDDFVAIGFEAAIKVVDADARDATGDPVEKFGGQGFAQGVEAFFFPAGDEVIALVEFVQ